VQTEELKQFNRNQSNTSFVRKKKQKQSHTS